MYRKTKFIAGVALIAQAFGFIMAFFALARRRQSSGAFFEAGFISGLVGIALIIAQLREEHKLERFFSALDGDRVDISENVEVPIDDTASEAEFTE